LVIIDRTKGGLSTWEIPRGPLWTDNDAMQKLLERIVDDAKKERCIALYLSPPISLTAHSSQLTASQRHIHCEATRIIDLTKSEDEILAQMHSKGRYNINVAKRHSITVEEGSVRDMGVFYELLQSTAGRDGFTISPESHYTRFLDSLEGSFILMAKHAHTPIAALIGVVWGNTGIYYYGASSHEDRQLMAPYLLQWEAMKLCKTKGCAEYDLLGIDPERPATSDPASPRLRGANQQPASPWAGITEFKRKFGGTVTTYPPEQMIVLRPWTTMALRMKRALFG
jgi:lipid II:glycine glycyltransferase (peptidoglycan interpeptide bridge formation enzyme)